MLFDTAAVSKKNARWKLGASVGKSVESDTNDTNTRKATGYIKNPSTTIGTPGEDELKKVIRNSPFSELP